MHNVPPTSHTPAKQYWCTYNDIYSDIYESSYPIVIVFYDEDEDCDDGFDDFDSFSPLLPGGLADG